MLRRLGARVRLDGGEKGEGGKGGGQIQVEVEDYVGIATRGGLRVG